MFLNDENGISFSYDDQSFKRKKCNKINKLTHLKFE